MAAFGGGRGRQQVDFGVGFRARSDMTGFCRLALDGAGTLRLSQRVNDARTVLIEEHAAPGFARGADANNALRLEVVGPGYPSS